MIHMRSEVTLALLTDVQRSILKLVQFKKRSLMMGC